MMTVDASVIAWGVKYASSVSLSRSGDLHRVASLQILLVVAW